MRLNWGSLDKEGFNKALKVYGSKLGKHAYDSIKEQVYEEQGILKPIPLLDIRNVITDRVVSEGVQTTYCVDSSELDENTVVLGLISKEELYDKLVNAGDPGEELEYEESDDEEEVLDDEDGILDDATEEESEEEWEEEEDEEEDVLEDDEDEILEDEEEFLEEEDDTEEEEVLEYDEEVVIPDEDPIEFNEESVGEAPWGIEDSETTEDTSEDNAETANNTPFEALDLGLSDSTSTNHTVINPKSVTKTRKEEVDSISFAMLMDGDDSSLDFINKVVDRDKTVETEPPSDSYKEVKQVNEINVENLPSSPIEFLRQNPRSKETLVKEYYSEREVNRYIDRGLIQRARGRLFI